jgi:phospholipase/carboxylesterase
MIMRSSRSPITLLAVVFGAGLLLGGCSEDPVSNVPTQEIIDNATIELQPPTGPTGTIKPGMYPLGLASPRDGFLYVPAGYNSSVPAPLLVLLHGAGRSSADWDTPELRTQYDANGLIVVATDSRFDTWDVRIVGGYHEDVDFLQEALAYVYSVASLDASRMGIGGFSDGASEAIGIGLANAHLFSRIVAFSPGLFYAPFSRGTPEVYVSHGIQDDVLSFVYTRDITVITLVRNGHTVQFRQFDDGHLIPESLLIEGIQWAASSRSSE